LENGKNIKLSSFLSQTHKTHIYGGYKEPEGGMVVSKRVVRGGIYRP
jgi:hypothetical protein